MFSNGNSFSMADGSAMELGAGESYGTGGQVRDGSRPPAAAWMFTVLIWRL